MNSPSTAALASLVTMTGTSTRSPMRRASATSSHPKFGALSTVPLASTMPGVPTPTPATALGADATRSVTSWRAASRMAGPSAGRGREMLEMTSPRTVSWAPVRASLPERSSVTTQRLVVSRSIIVAGLPGRTSSLSPISTT